MQRSMRTDLCLVPSTYPHEKLGMVTHLVSPMQGRQRQVIMGPHRAESSLLSKSDSLKVGESKQVMALEK